MGENLGGSIGEGWHHNYEISVEEKDAGILCLHLGDGQIFLCRQVVGDIYAPAGAAGLCPETKLRRIAFPVIRPVNRLRFALS